MLLGAATAGPFGAIGTGFASQAIITALESMNDRKFTPFGFIDYLYNFRRASPGDHVENLVDIFSTFFGGVYINVRNLYVLIFEFLVFC